MFVQEVEQLSTAQELYIRKTKRKRIHPPLNTLDPPTINLLMQFLARARFNVGEVHEEFTFQEAHQSQQTKWLCRMATMSSLQDFVPGEIKQLMRGEQVVDDKQTLTKEQVKDRIKTGYRKGSLARNLGLAVLHERKDKAVKPRTQQSNQDFIQKLLGKFSTSTKSLRHQASDFVQIDNFKSQATQAREEAEQLFSARPSSLPFSHRPTSLPAPQRHVNNKGDKEVIRALHIGLLVSSDEKRFSTIRSIILEHEQILRAKNDRQRKGTAQ
jgi:hypothetical protein